MRALYRKFYQDKKRGFTDDEFRQECESAAGVRLTEVLDYASTTKDVDYAKYFAFAGLDVTAASEDAPGSYLGLNMQTARGSWWSWAPARVHQLSEPAWRPAIRFWRWMARLRRRGRSTTCCRPGKPATRRPLKISRNTTMLDVRATLSGNTAQTFQSNGWPPQRRCRGLSSRTGCEACGRRGGRSSLADTAANAHGEGPKTRTATACDGRRCCRWTRLLARHERGSAATESNGAEERIRTFTLLRAPAPQAGASASSATSARRSILLLRRFRATSSRARPACSPAPRRRRQLDAAHGRRGALLPAQWPGRASPG